jgi:meso-butanediol dehydrogenase / (S,S)-butanediol dehydrogenase / diacetyl reductase
MNDFAGKTVLITGAAQGVGKQTTSLFADNGAEVVISDLNSDALKILELELKAKGYNVLSVVCDVSDTDSIKDLVEATLAKYGKIDFLVNNAAVSMTKKMLEITEQDWDRVFAVNVKGTFFMLIEVAKVMIEKHIKGSIVNVASIAGEKGRPNFVVYASSKAAVINVTKAAALEFAPHHIRVNAVAPGTIDTPMWADIAGKISSIENIPVEEIQKKWVEKIPFCRLASTKDIANAILFLCSDESSYITGQVINICGGLSII